MAVAGKNKRRGFRQSGQWSLKKVLHIIFMDFQSMIFVYLMTEFEVMILVLATHKNQGPISDKK